MDLEWKGIHFTDLFRRGGRSVKSSQKPCAVHTDARDARVTISQKACGLHQEWPEAFPRRGQQKPERPGAHGGSAAFHHSWIFIYKAGSSTEWSWLSVRGQVMEGLYSLLMKVAFNCGRDREPLKA